MYFSYSIQGERSETTVTSVSATPASAPPAEEEDVVEEAAAGEEEVIVQEVVLPEGTELDNSVLESLAGPPGQPQRVVLLREGPWACTSNRCERVALGRCLMLTMGVLPTGGVCLRELPEKSESFVSCFQVPCLEFQKVLYALGWFELTESQAWVSVCTNLEVISVLPDGESQIVQVVRLEADETNKEGIAQVGSLRIVTPGLLGPEILITLE